MPRKTAVVVLTLEEQVARLKQDVSALKTRAVYDRDLRQTLAAMVKLLASPIEDGGVFPPTSMHVRGKLVMIREKLTEIENAD